MNQIIKQNRECDTWKYSEGVLRSYLLPKLLEEGKFEKYNHYAKWIGLEEIKIEKEIKKGLYEF